MKCTMLLYDITADVTGSMIPLFLYWLPSLSYRSYPANAVKVEQATKEILAANKEIQPQ